MSFLNLFGSESKTDQTAYNQQVGASEGSIALGANSSGNRINISSADPAVAEAAIAGNAYVVQQAMSGNLAVTGRALDFAGSVTSGAFSTANLSMKTANDLAGKFMSGLQKNYQASTDFASAALVTATNAEQAALAQTNNLVSAITGKYSEIVASNTPGGVIQASDKTQFNTVLIVGAALVLLYLMSRK
jgi:hypothetical protein